jgi:menaquinone-dependent protoporphyrinogen oxidase
MASVLIAYSTQEGQTEKIALHVADRLEAAGCTVTAWTMRDGADTPPEPAGFDAVVVGCSVHAGQHAPEAVAWLRGHSDTLSSRPGALFSVSLSAAGLSGSGGSGQARAYLDALMEQSGWHPEQSAVFAGAVRNSRYGLLKRMLMRGILARTQAGSIDSGQDYEYTDWSQVNALADALLARLNGR